MTTTVDQAFSTAREAMLTVATLRELFKIPSDVSTVEFLRAYKAGIEVTGAKMVVIIDELLKAPSEPAKPVESLTEQEILTELLTPPKNKKCGFPKGKPRPFIDRVCSVCAEAYKTQQYRLPARCPDCVAKKLYPATSTPEPVPAGEVRVVYGPAQTEGSPSAVLSFEPRVNPSPELADLKFASTAPQTAEELSAEIRDRLEVEEPAVLINPRLCPDCGQMFERYGRRGSAPRCKPCQNVINKAARDERPVVEWPSMKIEGFPCASCVHGKVNHLSDTGHECTVELGRLCAPWGPAWKHEKKT